MTYRGADLVVATLLAAGVRRVFTLSGNHIMPIFDATVGTALQLLHVRQEAAAVHMADAWARLTGHVGIALVTGGQGHTNAAAALFSSLAGETPVVLLSGHAPTSELGRGAFQELPQAAYAAPVCKASWTVQSAAALGHELARAMRIAASGRPGPVHLSLPVDLLEAALDEEAALVPPLAAFLPATHPPQDGVVQSITELLAASSRPLLIAGPAACTRAGRTKLQTLSSTLDVPVVAMESPRGVNDPSLGALVEMLAQADLVLLLGKQLDFTLKFGAAPTLAPACRIAIVDPDDEALMRSIRNAGARLAGAWQADTVPTIDGLLRAAGPSRDGRSSWRDEVETAVAWRPDAWRSLTSAPGEALHPVAVFRAVQAALDRHPETILVSDGGEIGQWAQATLAAPHRIINGVAGSIGPGIPNAIGARVAMPRSPVFLVLGDGTFGFHMAEFDTAVRNGVPFVAIVGNDSRWNAEYQIQLREYGQARAHGCNLLPTRYDLVVQALGGHGEWVTQADQLEGALSRALASGKPACVNVVTRSVAAPVVRRQ